MANFAQIYKENKVAVIGVPLIILIVCFNMFVLVPGREARRKALLGNKPAAGVPAAGAPGAGAPAAAESAAAPTGTAPTVQVLPEPTIILPQLSDELEKRRDKQKVYRFPGGRNVFLPFARPREIVAEAAPAAPEIASFTPVVSRPDVTYHGFVTTNAVRVAIVRVAGAMHLVKPGALLPETCFQVVAVTDESLGIRDTADYDVTFDIPLADGAPSAGSDAAAAGGRTGAPRVVAPRLASR